MRKFAKEWGSAICLTLLIVGTLAFAVGCGVWNFLY